MSKFDNLKAEAITTSESGHLSFIVGMRDVWFYGLDDTQDHQKYMYGWGNGYIVVTNSHPFAKMTDYDLSIILNKDITCKRNYDEIGFAFDTSFIFDIMKTEFTIIGFDTAHSYNNMENSHRMHVLKDTQMMLDKADQWKDKPLSAVLDL